MGFNSGFKGLTISKSSNVQCNTSLYLYFFYFELYLCGTKFRTLQDQNRNVLCVDIMLLFYNLQHQLTPGNRVLPEKLTGPQLITKFPEFYGTRSYITHSHPLPLPVLIQIISIHALFPLLKIHFYTIFPSAPMSSKWSLALRFPTKTLYAALLSPIRAT